MLRGICIFAFILSSNVALAAEKREVTETSAPNVIGSLQDVQDAVDVMKEFADNGKDRALCWSLSGIYERVFNSGFQASLYLNERKMDGLSVEKDEQILNGYTYLILDFCQDSCFKTSPRRF